MKDIKVNIIYVALVIALFLSPLLMPSNGKDYTSVVICTFVALCFVFKVQSVIKTVIPAILYSIFMPMAILIAIARPVSKSWIGAINSFCNQCTSSILLSFIIPVLLAVILYFGLVRISAFMRK